MSELEEALVRLHALERRIPGGGRWPFAGDGPWHLIQGEAGDYAGDGQDGVSSSAAPRPPLDAGEVAEYERLKRWLLLAAPDRRRLLWEATAMLHRGEPRPEWGELKRAGLSAHAAAPGAGLCRGDGGAGVQAERVAEPVGEAVGGLTRRGKRGPDA